MLTPAPIRSLIPDGLVYRSKDWVGWFRKAVAMLNAPGVASGPLGTEPVGLSDTDIGAQYLVTTSADGLTVYNHVMTWLGMVWSFGGDAPTAKILFAVDPGAGWHLCDGGATRYLTAGATLGDAPIATPVLANVYMRQ